MPTHFQSLGHEWRNELPITFFISEMFCTVLFLGMEYSVRLLLIYYNDVKHT